MTALDTPCATDTREAVTDPPILVYPNPSSVYAEVTIAHAASMHVTVASMDGRQILHLTIPDGDDRHRLDLPDLAPGMYLFIFRDGAKAIKWVRKWVRV